MGKHHVEKWVEAIESIDDYPFWLFDGRVMSITCNACILVMLLAYVSFLICVLNSYYQAIFPVFSVLILTAIFQAALFAQSARNESGRLCCQKKWSGVLVRRFLDAENLTPSKLPQITESVKVYYQDRVSARKTLMDRTFALFICGVFVTAVGILINARAHFSIVSLALSLFACLLTVVIPPAVSALWNLVDSFHVASMQRTKSMLQHLECYALMD